MDTLVSLVGALLKGSDCGWTEVLVYPESNRDARRGRVRSPLRRQPQRQSTSFLLQLLDFQSKFGGAAGFGTSFNRLYGLGDRGIQPLRFLNS